MAQFARSLLKLCVLTLLGSVAVSCAHRPPLNPTPIRNPLVFIHGVMGAQLEQNGTILWGVLTPTDADTKDLPLPLAVPRVSSLDLHNRSETEAKVLDYAKAQLGLTTKSVWLHVQISEPIYGPLLKSLVDMGFDYDVGEGMGGVGLAVGFKFGRGSDSAATATAPRSKLLVFSYDWRNDNAVNARRLGEFLTEKRYEISKSTEKEIEDLRKGGRPEELAFASELETWLKDFKFDAIAREGDGTVPERSALAGGSLPAVTVIEPFEAEHTELTADCDFLKKLMGILGVEDKPSEEERRWKSPRKGWYSRCG